MNRGSAVRSAVRALATGDADALSKHLRSRIETGEVLIYRETLMATQPAGK